jgi:DNA polymerase III, alpha subunit
VAKTKKVVGMKVVSPGSPPDIDSDFSVTAREKAVEYVTELYGKENVANIVTFGTLATKSAFKSMCTIYEVPFAQANRVASMIPDGDEGHEVTFDDIYNEDSDYYKESADFREATSGDPKWDRVITGARGIAGRVKSTGVHACGIIISAKPLTDTVPLHIRKKDGKVITQWTYQECEALGLIKMDFLGLDTVDLIQHTIEYIQKSGKDAPNMIAITQGKMDDPEVYKLFQEGHTVGVFQFGSEMVRNLLRQMKPTEFNDLAACTAVARPGPMGMNSHTMYAERKNGLAKIEALHSDFKGSPLEKILSQTYGLCIYQEQSMRIASEIAGMTLQEGDKLRKAMGKKKHDIMMKMKPKFISGGIANGYSEEAMNKLWDVLEPFSKYAFNKCLYGETEVLTSQNTKITAEGLYHRFKNGEKNIKILSMFENGGLHFHNVSEIVQTGRKPLWTIETASGKTIRVTENHRMLTVDGYQTIKTGGIRVGSELIDDKYWNNRFRTVQRRPNPRRGWSYGSGSYHKVKNISFSSDVDRAIAENYLISRGAIFETGKAIYSPDKKVLGVADFYVNGTYFEMDSRGLGRQYLIENKYKDTPFVYLTPENYRDEIDAALMSHHISSGDRVVSITPPEILEDGSVLQEMTYDIMMADDGPANFIANGLVSHNSHSVAYAMNAYQAAYLKTHYPVEFIAALIAQTIDKKDKTLNNLREARRMGISMGTVNINLSDVRVSPDYSGESGFEILYGFSGVKGVSESSAEIIIKERDSGGRFTSVQDAVSRCVLAGITKKDVFINLAMAGAFDDLEPNRRKVIESIPGMLTDGRKMVNHGMDLFSLAGQGAEDTFEMVDVEDYPYVDRLRLEADMIGMYLTGHPMDRIGGSTGLDNVSIKSLSALKKRQRVKVVAAVSMESKNTRRGKMVTMHLDDGTGLISTRVTDDVVKGMDKTAARNDIRARFCRGDLSVPKTAVEKAFSDVTGLPDVQNNGVYLLTVDVIPAWGGKGDPMTKVSSIQPVTFAHDGSLPVRVRVNYGEESGLGKERASLVYRKLPGFVRRQCPGDSHLMIARYNSDKSQVSEEAFIRYALDIIKRDARQAERQDSSEEVSQQEGLLSDDSKSVKKKPASKKKTERQWPTSVPSRYAEKYPAAEDIQGVVDSLEYVNTSMGVEKSEQLKILIEDKVGHENYDFGIYVPVEDEND